MAQRIFNDGIETNDGGVAGLDPQLLQKVSDGTWETAVVGTEYFSPNQHGGEQGIVIRKYYSGTGNSTTPYITLDTVASLGLESIIDSKGYTDNGTDIITSGANGLKFAYTRNSGAEVAVECSTASLDWWFWIDFVKSTPPSLSPSSKVMPTIDPTVLQRVDDMTWEQVQEGAEYFSPNQHGGRYGKVIRRYTADTSITAGTQDLFTDTDIDKIIDYGGSVSDNATTPSESSATSMQVGGSASIIMQEATHTVQFIPGTIYADAGSGYDIWVDYNLDTDPTTRPTGQPFADPNSPMLKRADTGAWEIPQVGVLYYAKGEMASKGAGEQVYAQLISGTGWTGTVSESVSTVTADKLIAVEGSCQDDAATQWIGNGWYSSSSYLVRSKLDNSGNNLVIERGALMDGSGTGVHMWFYFTAS